MCLCPSNAALSVSLKTPEEDGGTSLKYLLIPHTSSPTHLTLLMKDLPYGTTVVIVPNDFTN